MNILNQVNLLKGALNLRLSFVFRQVKFWLVNFRLSDAGKTPSHLYQPYCHVSLVTFLPFKFQVERSDRKSLARKPCKVGWDKNLSLLCEDVDQYACIEMD